MNTDYQRPQEGMAKRERIMAMPAVMIKTDIYKSDYLDCNLSGFCSVFV